MRFKYFFICLMSVFILSIVVRPLPAVAQTGSVGGDGATNACRESFLTLPAWYNGLLDGDCEVQSPAAVGGFSKFVTIIGLNVVEMILRLSGYASAAFIIYGGYKYIYSAGSPDGMVSARKTIMNAVIGLVISIAAVAIVNTIAKGI